MLHHEKNKLPPQKGRERLEQPSWEYEYGSVFTARFRRWSTVYLGTALVAIILLGVLLLSGSVGKHALQTGSFWGRGAQNLGALLVDHAFADLSGKGNQKEDEDKKRPLDNVVDVLDGIFHPEEPEQKEDDEKNEEIIPPKGEEPIRIPLTKETLYAFDYAAVPVGKTPIIPMNLALSSYGAAYIHNSTGYKPDTAALLAANLKQTVDFEYLAASGSPMVLIVHTHATEGFCEDGATYCDTTGEYARSTDSSQNMVEVGKALAMELGKLGIPTLHCTVMHDELQYKDSYRRSEESIRQYLEKYPTIRLVIDLHRDAVVQSDGDVVRPVTLHDGKAVAQLMCVVGSSYGGQDCPNWEGNLSLALKLRENLNARCADLCRPPYLKASTYNQELAPYSLLIEAGAGGNSMEEVTRSMFILAQSLRELLPQI